MSTRTCAVPCGRLRGELVVGGEGAVEVDVGAVADVLGGDVAVVGLQQRRRRSSAAAAGALASAGPGRWPCRGVGLLVVERRGHDSTLGPRVWATQHGRTGSAMATVAEPCAQDVRACASDTTLVLRRRAGRGVRDAGRPRVPRAGRRGPGRRVRRRSPSTARDEGCRVSSSTRCSAPTDSRRSRRSSPARRPARSRSRSGRTRPAGACGSRRPASRAASIGTDRAWCRTARGRREVVELEIKVKVPLIGGKLEELLADQVRSRAGRRARRRRRPG